MNNELRAEFIVPDKHVVLFSGGIDSTYTAMVLKDEGKNPLLLFIDTGAEDITPSLEASTWIADKLNLQLQIDKSLQEFGRNFCFGHNLYIPRRNMFMGMIGAMYGKYVYLAGIKGDVSPDKSPEVLKKMKDLINDIGHENEKLEFFDSILWDLDKLQITENILKRGDGNEFILRSWSCYRGGPKPCGECIACLRKAAILIYAKLYEREYFKEDPFKSEAADYYKRLIKEDRYQENIPVDFMKIILEK